MNNFSFVLLVFVFSWAPMGVSSSTEMRVEQQGEISDDSESKEEKKVVDLTEQEIETELNFMISNREKITYKGLRDLLRKKTGREVSLRERWIIYSLVVEFKSS